MEEINKKEVSRYLTEKMGLCWHEYKEVEYDKYTTINKCKKCGFSSVQLDLFSPEGFFILLDWAKGEEWWEDFIDSQNLGVVCNMYNAIPKLLINPEVFPIEVYNYLRGREK